MALCVCKKSSTPKIDSNRSIIYITLLRWVSVKSLTLGDSVNIKGVALRVGAALTVVAAVGLIGCTDENNPGGGGGGGGGNYNNGEVRIGNQTWTTKNINIETPDSWCYRDSASYCAKYGRLYTWEAAKSACRSMGGGWRLPDTADWNKLVTYAGGLSTAGTKLKAKSGWYNNGNGTDDVGFSALPGGFRYSDGSFSGAGDGGYWWSATEYGSGGAYRRGMDCNLDYVSEYNIVKSYGFSVRCVQD
jgi:uncharacterized protein (TIGR02145 family)